MVQQTTNVTERPVNASALRELVVTNVMNAQEDTWAKLHIASLVVNASIIGTIF
jgi:hypothetical protein